MREYWALNVVSIALGALTLALLLPAFVLGSGLLADNFQRALLVLTVLFNATSLTHVREENAGVLVRWLLRTRAYLRDDVRRRGALLYCGHGYTGLVLLTLPRPSPVKLIRATPFLYFSTFFCSEGYGPSVAWATGNHGPLQGGIHRVVTCIYFAGTSLVCQFLVAKGHQPGDDYGVAVGHAASLGSRDRRRLGGL